VASGAEDSRYLTKARAPTRPAGRRHGTPVRDPAGFMNHTSPRSSSSWENGAIDPAHLAVPKARQRDHERARGRTCRRTVILDAGCDWNARARSCEPAGGRAMETPRVIAMRGSEDPDAFPRQRPRAQLAAEQLGLRRSIGHSSRARPLAAPGAPTPPSIGDHDQTSINDGTTGSHQRRCMIHDRTIEADRDC